MLRLKKAVLYILQDKKTDKDLNTKKIVINLPSNYILLSFQAGIRTQNILNLYYVIKNNTGNIEIRQWTINKGATPNMIN